MGCGTLDWADLYDHVSELLSEEADAPVREHLASCDACRADAGELMTLSEGFWALGILTHVTGREAFADRARSNVREIMGDKSAIRNTGAWRAITSAESQRMRRVQFRRKAAVRNTILTAIGAAMLLVAGVALLFRVGVVAYLIDTSGQAIESSLGTDLAEWGLRQTPAEVAELARAAKDTDGIRALLYPVERLIRRELFSPSCRVQAVVGLEFAITLARREGVAARDLIAAAVLEAGEAEAGKGGTKKGDQQPGPPELVRPELRGVIKRARSLRLGDDARTAQDVLLIPATNSEPLALYYFGLILAETKGWELGEPRFLETAERLPAVWNEIAWRRLRDKKPETARKALEAAPEGGVRKALHGLIAAARLRSSKSDKDK